MVDFVGFGANMIERRAWDRIGSLTDVASRVMLSFGEFEFSIDSAAYNAMKRTMEWRWDEQQLIGKKDLLQYTGKGARTISLEGMVHAGFRDGVGMDALDTLVQMVDKNPAPHLLVSGTGDVMGYFVVTAYSD
ncbi:phage tail protein, partial [Escherichia coli]|nr:phage tail protein [Escherichia coli]